ncbi:hypothetical protein PILCRDRAFT_725988 [Piloderma croceum F 1598]|uniref:Uncharacterized protein n=1 Tax=Piloderma croceum (strain F 1598) TaxID=765440 RepID=A0A0C3AID7_PILCF|nr:hypothetical protein PILCRDRAFT_725988 [Piloderma croceum F 1598]
MSRICRRGLPLNCGGRTACSAGAVGIYRIWNYLFSCARLASPSYFMPYMYNSNYSILHSARHLSLPSFISLVDLYFQS